MSHRALTPELIARAAQLRSTQGIGKALGVSDRALYGWLTDGSELGQQLLQVLVGLPEQEEP
jgi:hypothetical protein